MTEHLEGGKLPKKSIQRSPEFLVWCTEAAAGVAQSSCVHFGGGGEFCSDTGGGSCSHHLPGGIFWISLIFKYLCYHHYSRKKAERQH